MGGLSKVDVGGAPRVVHFARRRVPLDVVTALSEQPGYLANPGMGYQGWTYAAGVLGQSVEYRRGPHPDQGGLDWATMNPASGVYNWAPVDTFLAACAGRGQRGSFRVITMNGETYGPHCVPTWVLAAGATINDGVLDDEPEYRNRWYQLHWGRFVDALAARYDGDPRIAFVDISGYGRYNEWQANPNSSDTPTTADYQCRIHLIHAFVGGAGTTKVLEADGTTEGTLTYSHRGFQHTQLLMPYGGLWEPTRYVLDNYPHVGFRNDALFGTAATLALFQLIGHGVTDRWQTAPVVFEAGSDIGYGPGTHPAAVELLAGMHASILHENNTLIDQPAALATICAPLGYRYRCSQVRTPDTVPAGSPLAVETTWTNTGLARAYPRMGHHFAVTVALAGAGGTVVARWEGGQGLVDLLPGQGLVVTAWMSAPQAGEYTVLVGVVDQVTGQRILLPLNDGGRGDHWYPAGTITST